MDTIKLTKCWSVVMLENTVRQELLRQFMCRLDIKEFLETANELQNKAYAQ